MNETSGAWGWTSTCRVNFLLSDKETRVQRGGGGLGGITQCYYQHIITTIILTGRTCHAAIRRRDINFW